RRSFSIIAIMAGSPSAFAEDLQNVLVGQSILPRVDDAAQVNVGAKVTQRPLGLVWRGRLSRSTEFVYRLVNLRNDEVGIHAVALTTHRSTTFYSSSLPGLGNSGLSFSFTNWCGRQP